ncbi:glutamate--tRNA ligase [Mucisphaera sp.]|uniref:glutamate--tRNA ligase n=1 Tax=Mucisphaera sp. TaxID=2913024 RepID=UPI003D13B7CD
MTTPNRPVRTRFAPSPTGALHIGGVRTALFAWAYARKYNGTFILRIEDTDRKRSSEASLKGILRDLSWCSLHWDEGPNHDNPSNETGDLGPYKQSSRLDIYNDHIQKLIDAGRAYIDASLPEHEQVVRFRMDRDISFTDAVYGDITVKADDLEDFIIRKSKATGDAYPTFHLAVTVDDALMQISHVIRGQEHLANTPKHVAIIDALAEITGDSQTYQRPTYVHLPSILNPDGSKMSKRDKAKIARKAAQDAGMTELPGVQPEDLIAFLNKDNDSLQIAADIALQLRLTLPEINVEDFEDSGYLPEPLLNYLALLGWNPGDDKEQFSREEFVQLFSLDRINKANSKFDRDKLRAFNADYLQKSIDTNTLSDHLDQYLQSHDTSLHSTLKDHLDLLAAAYQERLVTLSDILTAARFFAEAPTDYNPKAAKKNLLKNNAEGLNVLAAIKDKLAALDDWTPEHLHQLVETHASEAGLKNMGGVAQPLRVALSGTAVTPPIDLTLAILGKTETLKRIDTCLKHFADASANT